MNGDPVLRTHNKIQLLRSALQDVVDPVGAMQRECPAGHELNHAAITIGKSLQYVQAKAREALAKTALTLPTLDATPSLHPDGEGVRGTLGNPSTFGKPTFGFRAKPEGETVTDDERADIMADEYCGRFDEQITRSDQARW